MSSIDEPSFWACLTLEFMNTVHLVPRSTGERDLSAQDTNSSISIPRDSAKFCRKEPQPDEQASFRNICLIVPFSVFRHFMSCPPMSMMNSTSGSIFPAALVWATVSISPMSTPKAVWISFSPYPVTQLLFMKRLSGIRE